MCTPREVHNRDESLRFTLQDPIAYLSGGIQPRVPRGKARLSGGHAHSRSWAAARIAGMARSVRATSANQGLW